MHTTTTPAAPGAADDRGSRRFPRPATTIALVVATAVVAVLVARLFLSTFQPHLYNGTVLQSPTPAAAGW